jgi:UrcA family protein
MNGSTATILMAVLATTGSHFTVAGPPDAPSTTVRYGDLDLTRREGAEALYRRLQGAAEQLCAPLKSRALYLATPHRACIEQAIAEAVTKVDRPLLTAYWQSKTGSRRVATLAVAGER